MDRKAGRRIALLTATLLLVPLVAMQLTNEVNWGVGDFAVGALLLLGAGFTYELVARKRARPGQRAAVAIAVGSVLAFVWIALAVGIA